MLEGHTLTRIPEIQDRRLDQIYLDYSNPDDEFSFDDIAASIKEIIPKTFKLKGRTVLDIACGCGGITLQLAKKYREAKVIGIDIAELAIKEAKQIYGVKDQKNLEFQIGDVYSLGNNHRGIDLITVMYSLHHFDNLDGALSQLYQALKSGGFLFIEDFDREMARYWDTETMSYLFQLRQKYGDQKCLQILSEEGRLDRGGGINLLTIMSVMAAYIPEEVSKALNQQGFTIQEQKTIGKRYAMLAFK